MESNTEMVRLLVASATTADCQTSNSLVVQHGGWEVHRLLMGGVREGGVKYNMVLDVATNENQMMVGIVAVMPISVDPAGLKEGSYLWQRL